MPILIPILAKKEKDHAQISKPFTVSTGSYTDQLQNMHGYGSEITRVSDLKAFIQSEL